MDETSPPDLAAHRDWLFSLVPRPTAGIWLDLGCGTGVDARQAARLLPPSCRVIGLDSSAKAIEVATGITGGVPSAPLEFRQQKIEAELPFETGSVAVAFSHNAIECLAEPAAFAREVGRVLLPGGSVVMAHWDWDSQLFDGEDKGRIRRLVHAFADWKQGWMDFADGWMGRRLQGLFASTGLFDGQTYARVLINTDFAAPYYGHARAQDFRGLVKRGLATAEDYAGFLDEQVARAETGRYFYAITGFVYVGARRAA